MQLALHPMEGYESQIVCDGDTWMKRYEELVSPSSCNEWLALVRYFSGVSEQFKDRRSCVSRAKCVCECECCQCMFA